MNFILLPDDIKSFLFVIMLVSFLIVSGVFIVFRKMNFKQAFFYGFLSSVTLTGLLFSVRSDYLWFRFADNMYKKYGGYSSDEKFMWLDVQNYGVHEFFMKLRPYLKGDYRLVMPNLIRRSPDFPIEKTYLAKANFILRPYKPDKNGRYLIVYDYDAVFDQQKGVLKIGDTETKGLEAVVLFDRGTYLLRYTQ